MYLLCHGLVSYTQLFTDVDEDTGVDHAVHVDNGILHRLRYSNAATLIINSGRLDRDCIGVRDVLGYGDFHGLHGIR